VGAHQCGDGVGAEVDCPQGGELRVEVELALGGGEGLQKAFAGDTNQLDLRGEVVEGNLSQEPAFAFLEDCRVEAVLDGVLT
jgi:hypothetical protein